MADQDDYDEDLFADLYDGDDKAEKVAAAAPAAATSTPAQQPAPQPTSVQSIETSTNNGIQQDADAEYSGYGDNNYGDNEFNAKQEIEVPKSITNEHGFTGTVGIKDDGKMFIGGLNWETTDESLERYFSQFGEVIECTVMRDGLTGRSRGFGFLTFKDPKTVNIVMVKEHYLDGKIIDPKRAIPRDEQEKTSKIFVGGVSSETTERDFESFFQQFGRVIDATLMMDKDTGRPRGFGFVTFEGEAAVDATLAQPLAIHGKPIEVKKAQPRGRTDEDDNSRGKFGRRGNERFGRGDGQNDNQQGQGPPNGQMNGMSPQMMAQYWQRMQQYFAMMQQQMAQNMQQGQGMGVNMNMGGMNPQMMQQMMAAQGMNQGQTGSPNPQNQGQNMQGINPQMMQQMQQMQQMQDMQQQGQGNGGHPRMMSPNGTNQAAKNGRGGFGAQDQVAFEQRKLEQQQARQGNSSGGNQGGGSQSSWEGMYDDVPPPNQPGRNRGGNNRTPQPQHQSQAPANAPTGPKNAGRPGANYRGGGRGGHRGYHPYSRN